VLAEAGQIANREQSAVRRPAALDAGHPVRVNAVDRRPARLPATGPGPAGGLAGLRVRRRVDAIEPDDPAGEIKGAAVDHLGPTGNLLGEPGLQLGAEHQQHQRRAEGASGARTVFTLSHDAIGPRPG
jgi:hypothetical protein